MPRPDLITEIQSLWLNNAVEGWNIAYDVVAEIGLDALTDEALEAIVARYRSEFGHDLPEPAPAGQMSFAI